MTDAFDAAKTKAGTVAVPTNDAAPGIAPAVEEEQPAPEPKVSLHIAGWLELGEGFIDAALISSVTVSCTGTGKWRVHIMHAGDKKTLPESTFVDQNKARRAAEKFMKKVNLARREYLTFVNQSV